MKLPKLSGYAIRCWGYRGSIISHPKLANPTSSCIHPSTHNQETFGNHLPQPSKSIRYTSYGNTPELPPQYWVASRLSHQQLHKRDFRCRRTKLRYSRTATIKLWRQHLGAQLPGTLPQPLKTGGTKNNVLVTKPSERFQDTRVILNFFSEIWGEKSQNFYVRRPHQSDEGTEELKESYSPIYIILRLKTFLF